MQNNNNSNNNDFLGTVGKDIGAGASALGQAVGQGINTIGGMIQGKQMIPQKPMPAMIPIKPMAQPAQSTPMPAQNGPMQMDTTTGAPQPADRGFVGNLITGLMSKYGTSKPQVAPAIAAPAGRVPLQPTTTPPSVQATSQYKVPGEALYVHDMMTQHPGNPQQYAQLYEQATSGPGWSGRYYGDAQPVQQPMQNNQVPQGAFSGFTTAQVPQALQPLIYGAAQQAGVDPNVFASVLFSEHGFQTTPGYNYNTDGSYDRGIAQINSHAHPGVSDQQALDPSFAVPYAANILASYIKQAGDINHGIAAYNIGPNGAKNPDTYNNQGKRYLGAIARGLTPQKIAQLGIQVGR